MIGICIAHLTGRGTDSSITVVLAVVAGVILRAPGSRERASRRVASL
jgi:hypothetical protein